MKAKLSGKEGLLAGILLEAFRASTPQRAVALGRDQAHLGQWYVRLFGAQLMAMGEGQGRGCISAKSCRNNTLLTKLMMAVLICFTRRAGSARM